MPVSMFRSQIRACRARAASRAALQRVRQPSIVLPFFLETIEPDGNGIARIYLTAEGQRCHLRFDDGFQPKTIFDRLAEGMHLEARPLAGIDEVQGETVAAAVVDHATVQRRARDEI